VLVILKTPRQSEVLCDYGLYLLYITSCLREILGISAIIEKTAIYLHVLTRVYSQSWRRKFEQLNMEVLEDDADVRPNTRT
jgi:hypothetical protein